MQLFFVDGSGVSLQLCVCVECCFGHAYLLGSILCSLPTHSESVVGKRGRGGTMKG